MTLAEIYKQAGSFPFKAQYKESKSITFLGTTAGGLFIGYDVDDLPLRSNPSSNNWTLYQEPKEKIKLAIFKDPRGYISFSTKGSDDYKEYVDNEWEEIDPKDIDFGF